MADIFDVIADPSRREIMRVLLESQSEHDRGPGEVSVSGLVEALGLSQPTVSKHLKVLRDSGLVEVREDGQHRLYRLRATPLETLEDWLVPFLGADDIASSVDVGATAFAAWAGSGLPKPLRKVAETIEHPTDAGAAVGRTAAAATHQVRTVIEGAAHAIEDATAKVEEKVIKPIKTKLSRRSDEAKS